VTVAVQAATLRHPPVRLGIAQQARGHGDNAFFVGADEERNARFDALRPFGFVTKDERRLAQRWRLFLHAAGVG
jgi:hypothetical protein